MARRRNQIKGYLFKHGNWWRLQYYERDQNGARRRKSVAVAPLSMSKREAMRAAKPLLEKVDMWATCPMSAETLGQFVSEQFKPEHVGNLKQAGKTHYKFWLAAIVKDLGDKRLRDIKPADVSKLVRALLEEGKAVQTARHLKYAVSAIFEEAKRLGYFTGENPARLVKLPPLQLKRRPVALTFDQGQSLLAALKSPIREMVLFSMTCSLNVAELLGMRWKRVNLTPDWSVAAGEPVPPFSAIVRENYFGGVFGTTKTGRRARTVPLPDALVGALATLKTGTPYNGPDDLVFRSRTGRPIDAKNINNREFKRIGEQLGVHITWHALRHTCATFAEIVGMEMSDRRELLGHATSAMTMRYTHASVERARESVGKIAERLAGPAAHPVDIADLERDIAAMQRRLEGLKSAGLEGMKVATEVPQ